MYIPIPESFLNYREYSRNVALHDRKTGDPQTPVIEVKVSSRQWTDQVHNWKNALATWEDQARQANRALLTNTSLNDFDHAATFEKEISPKFAILKLTNGKKALLHVDRVWIAQNPMYNGFYVLKKPSFKSLQVNARSITPYAGVEYQVTFCHSGVNTRDWKNKKFHYPEKMMNWYEKLVTLDALNSELKAFSSIPQHQI